MVSSNGKEQLSDCKKDEKNKIEMLNENNIEDLDALYFFDKVKMNSDSREQNVPMLNFRFEEPKKKKSINKNISKSNELKSIQIEKIKDFIKNTNKYPSKQHDTINDILNDSDISKTNKANFICLSILDDSINIEDAKEFLIKFQSKKNRI